MAINQIFVRLLDGSTRCLQIPSPSISGESLKRHILCITGVPPSAQFLLSGTRLISDETLISSAGGGAFPSCTLLLRLPGGKGGFGSLLRGAATKAGQKKTNNFDACRDMSGRRLRHVNAEKRLEEWRSEAEDRRLEKLAEDFLRKKAKEVKKNSSVDVDKYVDKCREESEKFMEGIEEAVRESFELYKEGKRKVLPISGPSKRIKIRLGKKKVDDESESDDDEDSDDDREDGDEKSVVLDDGNCSNYKKGEGSSRPDSVCGTQSDGESSGGGSSQSNLDEVNGDKNLGASLLGPDDQVGEGSSELGASVETDMTMCNENVTQDIACPLGEAQNIEESEVAKEESTESEKAADPTLEDVPETGKSNLALEKHVEHELVREEPVAQSSTASNSEEPLNFNMYNTAADLEVLGMERLKAELQACGLKCGGTLQERAARLFLLKTISLEKLPKKLLAKPPGGRK